MNIKSINIAVAEQITKVGSTKVIDTVVDTLVKIEVNKRASALESALKLHEETNRELKKVKPDVLTFNLDGSKASESYSKAVSENFKQLNDKILKIEKFIVEATENDKWGDLYNVVGKSGGKNSGKTEDVKGTDDVVKGTNDPTANT